MAGSDALAAWFNCPASHSAGSPKATTRSSPPSPSKANMAPSAPVAAPTARRRSWPHLSTAAADAARPRGEVRHLSARTSRDVGCVHQCSCYLASPRCSRCPGRLLPLRLGDLAPKDEAFGFAGVTSGSSGGVRNGAPGTPLLSRSWALPTESRGATCWRPTLAGVTADGCLWLRTGLATNRGLSATLVARAGPGFRPVRPEAERLAGHRGQSHADFHCLAPLSMSASKPVADRPATRVGAR